MLSDQTERLAVPPRRDKVSGLLRSFRLRRAVRAGSDTVASNDLDLVKGPLGLNLLFEPPEPKVEIVFVHGLKGGSRKTWSLNPRDLLTYWPQEWLPFEPGFQHTRIHSFGYDSDWSRSAPSTLTVHDFALALLADLKSSPSLRRNGHTPIVFVAHSMGGLVIKKAHLLATRNQTYKDISSRIHTMYFLGTPHRGSDSATYLKMYLSLPFPAGAKSFVKELMPDSQTVHDINYEFRYSCAQLKLFSFFESQPTAGIMIVEKQSAVIGLPNEEEQYLPANHRRLCKFEDNQDPSYLILTRKLKATVEDILEHYEFKSSEEDRNQLDIISRAFDNVRRPQSDLFATQAPSRYHSGSCQWLTKDEMFLRWLNTDSEKDETYPLQATNSNSRFLWLHGPPGSGKTIASGHIINYLGSQDLDVSYYFFKVGSNSTLALLLLSLAYQMAESIPELRQRFLAIIKTEHIVNCHDSTMIWNTLFLGCIFKVRFPQPQYWVIDAIDECPQDSLTNLVQMLARINHSIPLKIFLSSRPETKVRQIFDHENIQYVSFQTGQSGSLQDISTYLRSRPEMPADVDSQSLVELILNKCDGIFLWATLIMDRLDDCFSIEDMELIVKSVPTEMNNFYADIVRKIEQSNNADLAKCILKWVVSAPMPFLVVELREAIKLDIKRTLSIARFDAALSQVCRNLVIVNSDGRIQLMHQTVKTYITSEDSGFYVSQCNAHKDIALVCLTYLNDSGFQPRNRRRIKSIEAEDNPFDKYAVMNFAYHLEHSYSPSRLVITALHTFASNKTLIWVERIAETAKLDLMIKVIKGLKQYLTQLLDTGHFLGDDVIQVLGAWTDDLTHLVTNFGTNLIDSPESIYGSIPSLCPSSSFVNKTYTSRIRQRAICSSNQKWNERSSCIPFQSDIKSIATSSRYIAIGLVKGQVQVYDNSTLELVDELQHVGPVRNLACGNVSGLLISGSPKVIIAWSAEREKLWSSPIIGILYSVCFSPDDSMVYATVMGAPGHLVVIFDAVDGSTVGHMQLDHDSSDSDSDENTKPQPTHQPKLVRIFPLLGVAALTYARSHLLLYSLDDKLKSMTRISQFAKEGTEDFKQRRPQVLDVVFCPATEYRSFAVLYQDGDLVTVELDHYDCPIQRETRHIFARVLAISPDGRNLAVGENSGAVSLFLFDTLQLIHRITYDSIVTSIVFSPSGLSLYDVRGRLCNVWDPPSLMSKHQGIVDSSQIDITSQKVQDLGVVRVFGENRSITYITQAGNEFFMFCGRGDGSITVHDTNSSNVLLELKEHAVAISHLAWNNSLKVLYSVDVASRVIANRLLIPKKGRWDTAEQLINHRVGERVTQILSRQDDELAALIITEFGQIIWETGAFTTRGQSTAQQSWMLHPTDRGQVLLIDGNTIHVYSWNSLKNVNKAPLMSFTLPLHGLVSVPTANQWVSRMGATLLIQISDTGPGVQSELLALTSSDLLAIPSDAPSIGTVHKLPCEIKSLVGVLGSKIFFLTRRGWVCSYNLKDSSVGKYYSRHFFIPPFWRTGKELMIHIVSKSHLALVHQDELVVLRHFLDLEEKILLEGTK